MITLDIIENAVGIEYLCDNDASDFNADVQELIFSFANENQQPYSNTIVNL